MANLDTALWHEILGYLQVRHTAICRHWFEELQPADIDGGLLSIHTPNQIHRNYLQQRCRKHFVEAAQVITGALVTVRFVSGERMPLESPEKPPTREGSAPHVTPSQEVPGSTDQIVLSPDYSFDNFVTGPENRLAHAAAVAVANQPGTAYNPLFIHGGVGLGKTHLLQAICQTVLQRDPNCTICYFSCDAFVNQFMDSVQRGEMSAFRHRYRDADLLLLDDIHFLANRERTQEEFFHTFNALFQSKRQIVLSSDSAPLEIPQLEERLVSRFQSGMVAPIAKPSYETRVAIVRAKSALRAMELPDEVACYIAAKVDSNARELEGAINTVQGSAVLQDVAITLGLAREALGESALGTRPSQVTLHHITDAVTAFYNVKLSDLQSKRRQKSIAAPRQLSMYLARHHTGFSLEEIGGHFGGRDHTTVMHAVRVVTDRIAADPDYARHVDVLTHTVRSEVDGP